MIQVENLDFSYRRSRRVLEEVNLSLSAGHVYGLLGRNGTGKTTLLKLLCGLLFPQNGRVNIMGYVPKLRQPSFLSNIFFIPDEVYLPELSMESYVRLLRSFYARLDEELLFEAMDGFEVSVREKLSGLSYGQQKKALISLGIACNTPVLFMDEPTSGLDIPAKSYFRRLLSSVITEERCLLVSTHQVGDLENLIDALIIIQDGNVLVKATLEEITERLSFRQVREGESALYVEESLRGKWGCLENTQHEASCLDIELFFKAVLKEPVRIKKMFES